MKFYSCEEVRLECLKYFNGDDLATDVWLTKYALKNNEDQFLELTPVDMFRRLAKEFARIELKYPNPMLEEEIFSLFSGQDDLGNECFGDVIAQGSPMAGIGNHYQLQSLSNCFVIDPCRDSFGSILKTDEEQCQIMKRRGGVGHDISNIRPRGAPTNNAAKTTDGISAFMERFSNSCRTTAQGGRRGALLLSIDVSHYEIETFIDIKRDKTKVTGANISIKLTDKFMNAVNDDTDFVLQWPVDVPVESAKMKRTIRAKDLWDKIVRAAHDSAEPGLMFWDNVLKFGPADAYKQYRSSSANPCAELVMCPNDACRLMLLNLFRFITNKFLENSNFDEQRFSNHVQKAQRLMDDLVDLEAEIIEKIIKKIELDPEPEDVKSTELNLWNKIKNVCLATRRTGLGITGLGDAIAGLGVKYGTDEGVKLTEKFYRLLVINAYKSSVQLAKERGAFPAYDYEVEKNHVFINRIMNEDKQLASDYKKYGRRNIALTTTAPAGSVSILTQTTSGIEPVYQLSYTRRKKIIEGRGAPVDFTDKSGDKWQHFTVHHHGIKQWMGITGNSNIEESPYWNSTSSTIDWHRRIEIQSAAQKWICHSISSTINLPKNTTVETVGDIYMQGWKSDLKGLTIYRDGCRDGVLVELEDENKPSVIKEVHALKRPKELECDIHRVSIKGEQWLVLVGLLNSQPYEIFAGLSDKVDIPKKAKKGLLTKNGKKDGIATYNLTIPIGDDDAMTFKDVVNMFDNPNHGALTRTLSLSLRHGVPITFISEQLRKDKNSDMMSFSSVIARVLSKSYIQDGSKTSQKTCTECQGANLAYQQGCITCLDCGSSKCG